MFDIYLIVGKTAEKHIVSRYKMMTHHSHHSPGTPMFPDIVYYSIMKVSCHLFFCELDTLYHSIIYLMFKTTKKPTKTGEPRFNSALILVPDQGLPK